MISSLKKFYLSRQASQIRKASRASPLTRYKIMNIVSFNLFSFPIKNAFGAGGFKELTLFAALDG